jgi:hypothetical protein
MKKSQKIHEILREDHQSLENTVGELTAQAAAFLRKASLTEVESKITFSVHGNPLQ